MAVADAAAVAKAADGMRFRELAGCAQRANFSVVLLVAAGRETLAVGAAICAYLARQHRRHVRNRRRTLKNQQRASVD